MKRITAALLVLVMALCLAACGEQTVTIYLQTESVRTIYGQEIRMEYAYSDNGTPLSVKTYFNGKLHQTATNRTSNGLTYQTIVDADGNQSVQATDTRYDENGNVSRVEITVAGNLMSRTDYTYDDNGNMLTASTMTSNGTVTTTYTYNEHNNVTVVEEKDSAAGTVIRTECFYNERNYVIEERTYDGAGVLQGSIRYTYEADDSGRTLTYFDGEGEPTGEVLVCVYDEHGNLIEETTSFDGEVAQKIVNTYVAMEVPVEE